MSNYRQNLGKLGEKIARQYLVDSGYIIIEQNWRVREGEIDLIASEKDCLVFVEVKTRRSKSFGYPIESITRGKQEKMVRCAQHYLASRGYSNDQNIRIDIVAITLDDFNQQPRLEHLKNPVDNIA